jgi:hypothetical protein
MFVTDCKEGIIGLGMIRSNPDRPSYHISASQGQRYYRVCTGRRRGKEKIFQSALDAWKITTEDDPLL